MSRVWTIARNDFRHVLRDRLVWGAVVLLAVVFLPIFFSLSPDSEPLSEHLLSSAYDLYTYALLVVVAVGYNAVSSERAKGTVRLVLGLAGTRREFVFGKLISRLAITVLAVGSVLGVACLLTVYAYGLGSFLPFWVMGGWMLFYGIVWTAVAVGFSAAFASQYRTLGGIFLSYAVFSPAINLWETVALPLFSLVFTGSLALPRYNTIAEAPVWIQFVTQLNPLAGYFGVIQYSVSTILGAPTSLGWWFRLLGLGVFVSFGLLPLLVGVRRFTRADLNDESSSLGWSRRLLPAFTPPTAGLTALFASGFSDGESRVRTIARGDLNRALKNWVVQGAVALFVLVAVPTVWLAVNNEPRDIGTPVEKILRLTNGLFLPMLILATAVGYQAVVGERESGTIRYVLGLPGTRRDFVVGTLVSRLLIIIVALAPIFLFGEAIALYEYQTPYLLPFAVTMGLLLLLGLTWTAFTIGVSTAVSTRYQALTAALCAFLLFSVDTGLWGPVVRPTLGLLTTGAFSTPPDAIVTNRLGPFWFRYVDHLNPLVAFRRIQGTAETALGANSWYISPSLVLFSFSVLLLFSVGTTYIGYRRFARTDLG